MQFLDSTRRPRTRADQAFESRCASGGGLLTSTSPQQPHKSPNFRSECSPPPCGATCARRQRIRGYLHTHKSSRGDTSPWRSAHREVRLGAPAPATGTSAQRILFNWLPLYRRQSARNLQRGRSRHGHGRGVHDHNWQSPLQSLDPTVLGPWAAVLSPSLRVPITAEQTYGNADLPILLLARNGQINRTGELRIEHQHAATSLRYPTRHLELMYLPTRPTNPSQCQYEIHDGARRPF